MELHQPFNRCRIVDRPCVVSVLLNRKSVKDHDPHDGETSGSATCTRCEEDGGRSAAEQIKKRLAPPTKESSICVVVVAAVSCEPVSLLGEFCYEATPTLSFGWGIDRFFIGGPRRRWVVYLLFGGFYRQAGLVASTALSGGVCHCALVLGLRTVNVRSNNQKLLVAAFHAVC